MNDIVHRHPRNPLLTAADLDFPANSVFNPGVAEMDDEVVLLLRIEDRRGISHLRVARSTNGVDGWRIADRPLLTPGEPGFPLEEWGCEDPRITQVGPREWIIAYTAFSYEGAAVALARTNDFEEATRLGIAFTPWNKGGALLPERVDGKWFLLHRPRAAGGQEHIWYAWSDDLRDWHDPGSLMTHRGGVFWDGIKVGASAPPIKTRDGWLLIYHGVKELVQQLIYRQGVALLDLHDPRVVLARAPGSIMSPREPYERVGDAPNVIYCCGALLRGDEIWMYYGGADSCVALVTVPLPRLLDLLADPQARMTS